MYIPKIEWIGIAILFTVNMINSYFLAIDVMYHPITIAGHGSFLFLLLFALGFLFVSSVLITITLTNLHSTFSKKDSKIKMSYVNRHKLNQYKLFFTLCILFIGILSLIFFLQPSDQDFFKIAYGNEKYILFCLFLALVKFGLSGTLLALSAYLVYLSNELSQMTNTIIT